MAGYREFETGEVLTAANVDDFLAKQAVMKFADSSARDTALGTAVGGDNALREGMVAYLDDTNDLQVFNGTTWSGVAYRYAGTRYYTSSGSFDKADPLGTGDIGLRAIRVRMVGAGGGGGGAAATGSGQVSVGAGGNAGGYAESFITDIAGLAATVTVTRGAGGAGGVKSQGSQGGASSFGAIVTANGGSFGNTSSPAAPPRVAEIRQGGTASGDLAFAGPDAGSIGIALAVSSIQGLGGSGASSVFGSGGRGRFLANGDNARGYGSGGGAPFAPQNHPGYDGGAGSNGIVIVDCYV